MLKVSIDKIISLTDARNQLNKIVEDVEKDELYILTKGGNPAVAVINIKFLEKLTGGPVETILNPTPQPQPTTPPSPTIPQPVKNVQDQPAPQAIPPVKKEIK